MNFFGIHICGDEIQMFLLSLPFIGAALTVLAHYGRAILTLPFIGPFFGMILKYGGIVLASIRR